MFLLSYIRKRRSNWLNQIFEPVIFHRPAQLPYFNEFQSVTLKLFNMKHPCESIPGYCCESNSQSLMWIQSRSLLLIQPWSLMWIQPRSLLKFIQPRHSGPQVGKPQISLTFKTIFKGIVHYYTIFKS